MAAKARTLFLSLAAFCLPVLANVAVAEKPHLGVGGFASASHRGLVAAKPLMAAGMRGCLCDFGGRSRSTSKERDAETGLDWMKTRYFSGAQGRFTSPDKPFADQFPEDPQSWNLYIYVRKNPLKMVDEDGQSATLIGALGGGIIGGAVAAWRGESVWKGAASGAIAGAVAGSVIDTGGASLGVLALSGAAGGLTGGVVSRGLNGEGTTLKQAAVDAAVGGTVGVVLGAGGKAVSAALSKPAPAVAEASNLTASEIQAGIKNAPPKTGQDAISAPAVNRYVDKIRGGQTAPPIKVDGNVIVDGNHRYAAGVLTGKPPATTPETASPSQVRNAKPFGEIKVDPKDWGNH